MTQSSLFSRVAVAVSVAVHIAAVALSLSYAGAGLFAGSPEAVPVSLVTPDDVAAAAPETQTEPDLGKLDLRPSQLDSTSQQQTQPSHPQKQPAQPEPQPAQTTAVQQAALPPSPSAKPAQPAYTPPQPDISLRYQVDLGLKTRAAALPQAQQPGGTSDFDAQAFSKADIDATAIGAFRRRLKECGALPASIGPGEKVVIVLRATFTPDARLAGTPMLIEASASAKGPLLMQAAIGSLQACQPHITLPADKYAEWRVLDLRFTPMDFTKG